MYCHGASEFEQSRLTQFNFKALLNKAKSFISKPLPCLVLTSVVHFTLGGLWPQIKSNTILFTSSTKSYTGDKYQFGERQGFHYIYFAVNRNLPLRPCV